MHQAYSRLFALVNVHQSYSMTKFGTAPNASPSPHVVYPHCHQDCCCCNRIGPRSTAKECNTPSKFIIQWKVKESTVLRKIIHLRATERHLWCESHSGTWHQTEMNTLHLNRSQSGRYSIYLPRRDGRLSWPWWLAKHRDGLPVRRQSPSQVSTTW